MVDFLDYASQHDHVKEAGCFADYVNHCKSYQQMWSASQTTTAHECTHGTNSELRMLRIAAAAPQSQVPMLDIFIEAGLPQPLPTAQHLYTGLKQNAFYVGSDRFVRLQEPAFRKRDVGPAVPRELRRSRFETYVVGQAAWDDTPLYLFDEWVAYAAGAETGLDLVQQGAQLEKTDLLMGVIEFSIYATALAKVAVDRNCLTPVLADFICWQLQRCCDLYYNGREVFPWSEQEALMEAFHASELALLLRERLQFILPTKGRMICRD